VDDFLLQRAKGTEAEELFQWREELVAVKTHERRIKRVAAAGKRKFLYSNTQTNAFIQDFLPAQIGMEIMISMSFPRPQHIRSADKHRPN
jgi:hypothetical protein